MNETLLGCRDNGLNGLYQCAAVEGYAEVLCSTLDESKCEFSLWPKCEFESATEDIACF
jgi:hypothetical protein